MKWYCYLIQCSDKKQSIYCGITNDLEKRLTAHSSGKGAKFLRSRGPLTLLCSIECESKSEALKLEYRIKQLSRKEKLELITDLQKKSVNPLFWDVIRDN